MIEVWVSNNFNPLFKNFIAALESFKVLIHEWVYCIDVDRGVHCSDKPSYPIGQFGLDYLVWIFWIFGLVRTKTELIFWILDWLWLSIMKPNKPKKPNNKEAKKTSLSPKVVQALICTPSTAH